MTISNPDPNTPPNNRVALIVVEFEPEAGGKHEIGSGSGVMVGRNEILTAAHVVVKPHYKTVNIAIYPAYDGGIYSPNGTPAPNKNYGSFNSIENTTDAPHWKIVSQPNAYWKIDTWAVNPLEILPGTKPVESLGDTSSDLALIGINDPIGDKTGWDNINPSQGSGTYTVMGYPGGPPNPLVADTRNMSFVPASAITGAGFYTLDLRDGPAPGAGTSGGPILNAKNEVVGVFSSGIVENRIDNEWTYLKQWMSDDDTLISSPSSNLILNGSFEQGPNPSDYLPLNPGSTAITGWTVIRGAIDYVGSYFVASNGFRCLDLNGTPGVGGVAQTFATVPGQTYQVSFDMAGNSDLSNALQTMEGSAAGQAQDFTFVSGTDKTHLGWQRDTWTITANAPQTTLEFYSLQTANPDYGPMLDNVVVQAAQPTTTSRSSPPSGTTTTPPFVTLGGQPPIPSGALSSATAQINPAMTGSTSSTMSFLAASEGIHIISAQVSGETLVGSSQFGDTFKGVAANLNGDLIKLFGGNDIIDVTDLNFGPAVLSYSGTSTAGTLSLTDGVHSSRISLAGDFRQANFHLTSDMHTGTNITYG